MSSVAEAPAEAIDPFVRLALACIRREYPNQVALRLNGDADLRLPRELTPAFYGCYDWHSAVHAHWLLARAVHHGSALADECRRALAESLTAENVARELLHLDSRPTFERPYGLAWVLALHHELAASKDWALVPLGRVLRPLAMLAGARLSAWLVTLHRPIRSGVHSQTAFSLGLFLDWSRATETDGTTAFITRRVLDYHGEDRDLPLHLEPSGEDFLSPSLGTADLMSRVLGPEDFATWLTTALPNLTDADLTPVSVMDESDGRLAHLDGLNLSRAWMLKTIGKALPEGDPRRPRLEAFGQEHAEAGLSAIAGRPYEGAHWLGTFAAYLITGQPG